MAATHLKFSAELRDKAGKGVARALRRENKVPAVIYGAGKEPVIIAIPAKETNIAYNKGHMFTTLTDIEVNGEKHQTLARDVQTHPVKDTVQHIDFLRVSNKTTINVDVPVSFLNEEDAPYSSENGILNVVRHEVGLVCKATNIPESLDVDLSSFNIGDSIKMSDAALPEGTKPVIDDRDFTIATIAAPKTAEQEEAEEAEADADIEAGTETEEGAEGGDAAEASDEKSE